MLFYTVSTIRLECLNTIWDEPDLWSPNVQSYLMGHSRTTRSHFKTYHSKCREGLCFFFFKHRSILLAEYSLQYNAICMYSTQKEKGMLSNHPNLIKADGQT